MEWGQFLRHEPTVPLSNSWELKSPFCFLQILLHVFYSASVEKAKILASNSKWPSLTCEGFKASGVKVSY